MKKIIEIDKDIEELIPGFLDNRNKDIVELENAINEKNFSTLKSIGHKLAGNAGSYGFTELGDFGAI